MCFSISLNENMTKNWNKRRNDRNSNRNGAKILKISSLIGVSLSVSLLHHDRGKIWVIIFRRQSGWKGINQYFV